MKAYIKWVVLAVVVGLAANQYRISRSSSRQATIEKDVVLNKIQEITKLATVEGYFSEIYDYKEYVHWDIPWFQKKALIRVRAKVLIGNDLENLDIVLDPVKQVLHIDSIPPPQLLSVDHNIDYYDITEGVFNTFSESDFNRLNKQAKNYIAEVAQHSDLMITANKRQQELIIAFQNWANTIGWQIEFRKKHSSIL